MVNEIGEVNLNEFIRQRLLAIGSILFANILSVTPLCHSCYHRRVVTRSVVANGLRESRGSIRLISVLLVPIAFSWAFAASSISGVVKDPSGAAIPGAKLTLINTTRKTEFKVMADAQGFYSFPSLPVGHYDLTIQAPGFQPQQKVNLTVDTDAALRIDTTMEVGQRTDVVTVHESQGSVQTQVDTVTTHLGEVVSGEQIQSLPLNGRSYTDQSLWRGSPEPSIPPAI